MRRLLVMATFAVAPVVFAEEGTIAGEVQILLTDVNGARTAKTDRRDVVVYVSDFDQPPPVAHARIVQHNKTYVPQVLAIVKGQTVDFENTDRVVHNVFSASEPAKNGNQVLDLGQSKGNVSHLFNKTGVVDLYCDIHESMLAWVLVLRNQAFATTSPDGKFVLAHVPAGKHTVYAWSRYGKANASVTVEPAGTAVLVIQLPEIEANQSHRRKDGKEYSETDGPYH